MTSPSDAYIITTYSGRGLPKEYRNLIYSKWLRSLRYGNDLLKMVDSKAFYSYHNALIDDLLLKPDTHVRIASLEDDTDVVLGFCVARPDDTECIIDYVYVNRDMRKQGIGNSLLPVGPSGPAVFTHATKTGMTIAKTKYPTWGYNPYK